MKEYDKSLLLAGQMPVQGFIFKLFEILNSVQHVNRSPSIAALFPLTEIHPQKIFRLFTQFQRPQSVDDNEQRRAHVGGDRHPERGVAEKRQDEKNAFDAD
jgi:hypothetical protein